MKTKKPQLMYSLSTGFSSQDRILPFSSVRTEPKREGMRTPVKVPMVPDFMWKSMSLLMSMSATPSP